MSLRFPLTHLVAIEGTVRLSREAAMRRRHTPLFFLRSSSIPVSPKLAKFTEPSSGAGDEPRRRARGSSTLSDGVACRDNASKHGAFCDSLCHQYAWGHAFRQLCLYTAIHQRARSLWLEMQTLSPWTVVCVSAFPILSCPWRDLAKAMSSQAPALKSLPAI